MDNIKLAQEIIRVAVRCSREGLMAGTSGNLSARTEEGMIITPSSIRYDELMPQDMVHMSLDGEVFSGDRPSSEWRMHAEIYKGTDAGAVVHTHSPYATAFAAAHKPIESVLTEIVIFLKGDISVAPYAPPGTAELGFSAVPFLKDRTACLLANHGAVAIGNNIEEAALCATYLEDAAKTYSIACIIGEPKRI